MNPEAERIREENGSLVPLWEKWGPYAAERGWGTVREDYSPNGDAWNYFPHDQARMRAYRRAEDGIGAISDRSGSLLFSPAFWNGADPILKERLFGLNCYEGNHGEDVKEIYYYLDATPSHSYLKYLYKYPQLPFPYERLIEENRNRGVSDREFELIDTSIFEENRYFDIFIEYGKEGAEDLSIRITAFNRSLLPADLHILPQLWFRNQWSWGGSGNVQPAIRLESETPLCLMADDRKEGSSKSVCFESSLGPRYLYASEGGTPLFTNNETNRKAVWGEENETPFVKDAFHRYLIQKEKGAVNPDRKGTKGGLHFFFPQIGGGKTVSVLLRLTDRKLKNPLDQVVSILEKRKREADLFYGEIHPKGAGEEEKKIQRQALAGMIWNKQVYIYNVGEWLQGDFPKHPPVESRRRIRNFRWRHFLSLHVFSMPDTWEFPWFAAWDLAFHSVIFSLIDIQFAKKQIWTLLLDQFQHPNGAIPAYEWEFSDVNPPIQAWAILKVFEYEKKKWGKEDFPYLEKCFHKLLLNFSWWINRVDRLGNNVFEGGFLGMDNIGFKDRSETLLPGCEIDQADGAGWISLFCLNLMRIALTLAKKNRVYEELGIKFFHHFIYLAAAIRKGYWRNYDMWNEEDGFFYSFIRKEDGTQEEIKVRSLVGIIPFFASDIWDEEELKKFPRFYEAYQRFIEKKGTLASACIQKIPGGTGSFRLFGLLSREELEKFLKTIWNPDEFRSEYGLRSLSKYHEKNPVEKGGFSVRYEPGEALEKIKGGNSNWRGPIWFPMNYLLIDTLLKLGKGFEENLKIGIEGEPEVTLDEMGKSFAKRLVKIFEKDRNGNRPVFGEEKKFQEDPHFNEWIHYFEYFHGETGRGLGASHQTGWTALVANLIEELYSNSL